MDACSDRKKTCVVFLLICFFPFLFCFFFSFSSMGLFFFCFSLFFLYPLFFWFYIFFACSVCGVAMRLMRTRFPLLPGNLIWRRCIPAVLQSRYKPLAAFPVCSLASFIIFPQRKTFLFPSVCLIPPCNIIVPASHTFHSSFHVLFITTFKKVHCPFQIFLICS